MKIPSNNKNNNNNKAFKSQTSWGRLELKPSKSNQGLGTWITFFHALLSKAKSLDIFYPFKSSFIASTQVNFGLPLEEDHTRRVGPTRRGGRCPCRRRRRPWSSSPEMRSTSSLELLRCRTRTAGAAGWWWLFFEKKCLCGFFIYFSKKMFAECILGTRQSLCRVSDKKHSAKSVCR